MEEIWEKPWVQGWTQYLLDSYVRLIKQELITRDGTLQEQAERLFNSTFVVASHGLQDDPILNYGNEAGCLRSMGDGLGAIHANPVTSDC
jgi:hypothetical protein